MLGSLRTILIFQSILLWNRVEFCHCQPVTGLSLSNIVQLANVSNVQLHTSLSGYPHLVTYASQKHAVDEIRFHHCCSPVAQVFNCIRQALQSHQWSRSTAQSTALFCLAEKEKQAVSLFVILEFSRHKWIRNHLYLEQPLSKWRLPTLPKNIVGDVARESMTKLAFRFWYLPEYS